MQRQNVRAQQHSKYLNYQNKEIKARGTKNMSIITDVNRVPEIISKESPKESKYCEKPKEWLKGQYALWARQFQTEWMKS